MKQYTIETRGATTCPAWNIQSCHSSDEMAIAYWSKLFASNPANFPTACDLLVIFSDDCVVAELFRYQEVKVRKWEPFNERKPTP